MTLIFDDEIHVSLENHSASDLQVARSAWVSTKGRDAREAEGRIEGLINYLMKNKHGTPFEHNMFTFFVQCPMCIGEEHLRHRTGWSYNKWSGRYSEMKPRFYVMSDERKMVQTGKPGEYIFVEGTNHQRTFAQEALKQNAADAWARYQDLLSAGIAKELARMVLPSNIYTSYYATCNARSLMNFLALRTEDEKAAFVSRPQDEIQQMANKMEALFAEIMPITYKAWNDNGRVAP